MSYRDDEGRSSQAQRLLSRIQIASPCPASWDAMAGNERTRMCGLCDKRVHDLSQLTALESLRLITEAEGSACVRLYRRADGRVQTADCQTGPRRKKHRRLRVLGATAASAVLSGAAALTAAAWPETALMLPDREIPTLPDSYVTQGLASPVPEEVFDEDTFLHGHQDVPPAYESVLDHSPQPPAAWATGGPTLPTSDAAIRELFEGITDYTEQTIEAIDDTVE